MASGAASFRVDWDVPLRWNSYPSFGMGSGISVKYMYVPDKSLAYGRIGNNMGS